MRAWFVLFLIAPGVQAQELAAEDPAAPLWEEILRLRERLDELEARGGEQDAGQRATVDLSGDELTSIEGNRDHVLSRPWYDNVALSGYGALLYLDSGNAGTTPEGSFILKEASLFVDAEVWKNVSFSSEIWLARYLYGNGFSLGELYLQFSGLGADEDAGERGLGLRVGRFEIPFGEEYLRWDANETPMITFSAADPYGIDRGVELFGAAGPVHWIAAVTNGASGSADDGPAKQVALKLYGEPHRDLYTSASALVTGDTEESAFRLSGSTLTPVGADGASSAGTSPSDEVNVLCWQVDVRIAEERRSSVALQFARGRVDDDEDAFDRELTWFLVMPEIRVTESVHLVARYSAIGTFDDDEGYRFEGKHVADAEVLGYDTSSLRRLSGGVFWSLNPNLAVKFEVGQDRLELIDGSTLDANNDERFFFGVEVVGSF